jgi:DNA ligase (NAD+)
MVHEKMYEKMINDPIETLKSLPIKQIVKLLEKADIAFFNSSNTLLPDDIYDMVKQYIRDNDPNNQYLKKVGAEIEINKEELPIYMGSLDKIKDSEANIVKWKNKYKGNYVISEKLDGISCLLYHDKNETKLLTRGNGYIGQNISHILPYLRIDVTKLQEKIAIRGELIISRSNWNLISNIGANARNVVAGAVHTKTVNKDTISKIDFVAYDILFPRKKLSESLEYVKMLDIPVVNHIVGGNDILNLENLSQLLAKWRKESLYEIDGIVIQHDEEHNVLSGKNPKHAFAFKTIITNEQAEVIVTDVEWNISKHRYLKPLIKFEEISLGGVKIKQATGFNAAFIKNNKIGPGSHIIIVRSGDVIPHVLTVLTPSSNNQPKMPSVSYDWTETNIDIFLKGDEKNREHDINAFVHFMKTLDIDGVKDGVITKMYDAGFDTLKKIINISLDEIRIIPGFKDKSALKLYQSLQKISTSKCEKLLIASNVFGRGLGEKKLKLISDVYPFIEYDKTRSLNLSIDDLIKINGIAVTTADQFIKGIEKYFEFCEDIGIECKKSNKEAINNQSSKFDIFKGKKVVFSGFRNKEYEDNITNSGGTITTALSKATNYLIVKEYNDSSAKIKKALEYGTIIMTKHELENI